MPPLNPDSKQANASGPAICIRLDTHACRAMRAAKPARFTLITEFMFFPTPSLRGSEKNRSMFIQCDSTHASCGAPRPRHVMLFTLTSGMTTLNKSDAHENNAKRFESLPSLPKDKGEPIFAEPWEAQAFAMAVKLSELGCFTWKEWAAALAAELRSAAD